MNTLSSIGYLFSLTTNYVRSFFSDVPSSPGEEWDVDAREQPQSPEIPEARIKRIIAAATGDAESESKMARVIRKYIAHASDDPVALVEEMTKQAELTDRVMEKIAATAYLRDMIRMAKSVDMKDHAKEYKNSYLCDIRTMIWSEGPDNVRENSKNAIRDLFGMGTSEDKMNLNRVLSFLFPEERAQPEKAQRPAKEKYRKEKPAEASDMPSRAVKVDIEKIRKDISCLLTNETARSIDLKAQIAELTVWIPAISRMHEINQEELTALAGLYDEQRAVAKALLNEKNQILAHIRTDGGKIDGYETPPEIITLIEAGRAPRAIAEPCAKSMQGGKITMGDVDMLLQGHSDPELLKARQEIEAKRRENLDLQERQFHLSTQEAALKRQLSSMQLETEKMTNRGIAIEEAGITLKRDVRDLKIEMTNGISSVVTSYPSLCNLESWANDNLKNRVHIHRNAFNVASGLAGSHKHPEWIYQGLELLANEYWDQITSGDYDQETAQTLRASFSDRMSDLHMRVGRSVTDIRNSKMRDAYHATFEGQRLFLDQHLRRGTSRDPRQILCIYFTWKAEDRKILVGHLPTHLELGFS